jgi:uncharacterized Zn-binding protein involved in type VI secretion
MPINFQPFGLSLSKPLVRSPSTSSGRTERFSVFVDKKESAMPAAACVGDTTSHGGTITGPGVATVMIGGKPAAVLGDMHACSLPPSGHQPTVSPFTAGSATVMIGGRPALRVGDACACGASAVVGCPTVMIG